MNTHRTARKARSRFGFTLVELLVAMTVIAILVGMLSVAVGGAFRRAREFAIQTDMNQLESAIEKFKIDYGFYPPSFKALAAVRNSSGDRAAASRMLDYLNRIAPNNAESQVISQGLGGSAGQRRIDIWWASVGNQLANAADNPGSDLVFWLSGLSKNKQYPLTYVDNSTSTPTIRALAAHNLDDTENPRNEREILFEFKPDRMAFSADGKVAGYRQTDRAPATFVYLDANNYLPSGPTASDGAYCNPGFSDADYDTITDGSLVVGSPLFNQLYPNSDKFQLIAFGLDGQPGVVQAPNIFSMAGIEGADNFVNFGGQGPTKLETVILELN